MRLKHSGTFRTSPGNDPVDIKGEQYFTAEPPGFVWIGKTSMFKAVDQYIDGKGKLKVKILSLIPVESSEGFSTDKGELLRWLGESVWFPTNLLPRKGLSWSGIDDNTARLEFSYNDLDIYYIVKFNDQNEIYEIRTKRYKGKKGLSTWIGRLHDYSEENRMHVPHKIEAIWAENSKEYKYADFRIEEIEYGIPEKY